MRTLFGNPVAPLTKHVWTLEHPVITSFVYVTLLLALGVAASVRRYRIRTTD
ncbi:MAG: hypothetical protein R2715_12085 [Ilumatobacteraceae bacterium]